ncbi:MAG TPA: hypothetical protein VH678_10595 [Xanthobacteraceae bacterium]|jgi:hypothetical protein
MFLAALEHRRQDLLEALGLQQALLDVIGHNAVEQYPSARCDPGNRMERSLSACRPVKTRSKARHEPERSW